MRTIHSCTSRPRFHFFALSALIFVAAGNPGGCGPGGGTSVDDSGGASDPGSIVLGIVVENPPGQDPNDPATPSTQLALENGAILDLKPASIDFGDTYTQISFVLQNVGAGEVPYVLRSTVSWAELSATQGSNAGERDGVTVTVNRTDLPTGDYEGAVVVSAENSEVSLDLRMRVSSVQTGGGTASDLLVGPAELDFGLDQSQMTLRVQSVGRATVNYSLSCPAPWVSLAPSSGSSATEVDDIIVSIQRDLLTPGVNSTAITTQGDNGVTRSTLLRATGASTHLLTGRVRSVLGVGVPGIAITTSGGGGSATTDDYGNYAITVPHGWHGTVQPTSLSFVYDPPNRVVLDVRSNRPDQNFMGHAASAVAPGFFIRYADGEGRIYQGLSAQSDNRMSATVQQVGPQQWELNIQNGAQAITEVWFPWDIQQVKLNENITDDVLFTPLFAGVARLPHEATEYGWNGFVYPSGAFAPLNVLSDPYRARIVAATMWPPKKVTPMWSLHRMSLKFDERIEPGQTNRYTMLNAFVEGNAAAGVHPWMLAAEKYSSWLQGALRAAGEYPNPAPRFKYANGWLHVGLMNMVWFDQPWLDFLWDTYGSTFPIVQMWGQMSNYAGDDHTPVPPLNVGETVGCCLTIRDLHPRYVPGLVAFENRVKAAGGGISLYTRPRADPSDYEYMLDDTTVMNGETHLGWYQEWIRRNLNENGANGLYLDVIARRHLGPPSVMRQAVAGAPHESVTEGMCDLYPFASLISGFIHGQIAGGLPERPLELLGQGFNTTSVPRFGRYVLSDRYVFLGQTNLDENWWGPAADHLIERQIFLLGAKFDIATPWEDFNHPEVMAPVVRMILDEWNRVGWWPREPQYRDRLGITNLPVGVDARHFIDKDGVSILAIENWQQQSGLTFEFWGNPIEVPTAKLSLVEPGAAW